LEDCTSPVVVPGVVDFTDSAEAAYQRFANAGMHRVLSTQPIATWAGLQSLALRDGSDARAQCSQLPPRFGIG